MTQVTGSAQTPEQAEARLRELRSERDGLGERIRTAEASGDRAGFFEAKRREHALPGEMAEAERAVLVARRDRIAGRLAELGPHAQHLERVRNEAADIKRDAIARAERMATEADEAYEIAMRAVRRLEAEWRQLDELLANGGRADDAS